MTNTKEFVVSSTHPEDLANGRVVAPGEVIELSREQLNEQHNSNLIQNGRLNARPAEDRDSSPEPTEAANQLASELGVNIAEVEGTGADGRVTVGDVESFAGDQDNDNSEEDS
jgi:pyruvate/2-oxoglutarate dehydrogenase complex dihydrolipoamide acyltransferase (E2) component